MDKRVIAILTAVVTLLSSILPLSFASNIPDYSVNYDIYAFTGTTSSSVSSRNNPKGSAYVGPSSQGGGFYVHIPPSAVGGYLITSGLRVIRSGSYTSWTNVFGSDNTYVPQYYILGTGSPLLPNGSAYTNIGQPYTGITYIPPHSAALYLTVYGSTNQNPGSYGCFYGSTAVMQFVPDTGGGSSDVVAGLQQVNQSIQNVYNEIHSSPEQDAESQQMLEELEKISDQIEELSQQLDAVIERPPADQVIPSIGEIIKPPDEAAETGMEALGSLFSSPLVVSLLVMAISFSIIRYVLYGKGDG